METKQSNPISTLLGGILTGMAVAFITNRRDSQVGEPTVIDKVKNYERKLYTDGQKRAYTVDKIKLDAEVAASTNSINEKSAIQ